MHTKIYITVFADNSLTFVCKDSILDLNFARSGSAVNSESI